MSFLPHSGIMHSNENFDATSEMTGADAIAPDETDTLAAAVSEITADEAAINAGHDQIDAAAVTADGLETIAETVAEANEGDGISEETAAVIEASVEALLKVSRIGVTYKQLGIPSSESFSSSSSRVALGKATCEALNISGKKIWQSIVDAIKKSIEWVRNFFNKIFGAAERLARRANSLKESTTKLNGKPENSNLENDSLWNAVRVNGSPATLSDLQNIAKDGKAIFAAQKSFSDAAAKVDDLATTSVPFPKVTSYGLKPADSGIAKRVTAESDVAVFVTNRLPGEVVVYLAKAKGDTEPASAKDAQEQAAKIKAGSINVADKKDEGKNLKVLGIDEIRGFSEAIEKYADEVSEYKRNLAEINSNKAKFIQRLEKFMTKGDGKAENDSKADASKRAKASSTVFRKLMDEPAASFAAASIRSMSAALQYAELSARQYEKKD